MTTTEARLQAVRKRARQHTVEVFPHQAWVACPLFVEHGLTLAAVVELAHGTFFYVYADSYTFATGEASTAAAALARMWPQGRALVAETSTPLISL